MNKQAQMIREFQRRGIDPSELIDRKEWDKVRLSPNVRTRAEVLRDGAKQAKARIERKLHIHQVPDAILLSNLAKCRTNECGSYGVLKGGDEVCWRCSCAGGKELFAKAGNINEKCPHDPPFWNNTTLTINGNPHA